MYFIGMRWELRQKTSTGAQ